MNRWRRINHTWCNWPSKPLGLIELIGGSYLSISPHISYRRLLEELSKKNLAIHTWSYIPGLDHQSQANEAWKDLRSCRNQLQKRIGFILPPLRIGHSLGCKLHLLAPDGGRNSKALVTLGFNNFTANRSIPMMSKLGPQLGLQIEFSPSPKETYRFISEHYLQPKNLLINFSEDKLDQSTDLLKHLNHRKGDESIRLEVPGDHLTPASAGVRKRILGEWGDNPSKMKSIQVLINKIYEWASP